MPKIDTDIDATEVILSLAPETNGHVAVKAWRALSAITGRYHTHLGAPCEEEQIRFRDLQAQPRRTITSPIWSGLDDKEITYNASYPNVHELIPWRTLSGRQELYQDHLWMRAFGEARCVHEAPVRTPAVKPVAGIHPNGNPEIALNFITPHQKWGIHSTYSERLIMLSLSRGGGQRLDRAVQRERRADCTSSGGPADQ